MGFMSRLRSIAGGDKFRNTVASGTTTYVPDDTNVVLLTGTATVTSLVASKSTRCRLVWFVQNDSGTTTFTNTDDTTTADKMDLGGSNRALAQTDTMALYLRADGSWVRMFSTDN